MEGIKTDVLVIGGGLAGLVASIRAREMGSEVILLSRSPAGKSGNTIVSGAAMCVYKPDNPFHDSKDLFFDDIQRSGKGLSRPEMARRFVEESEGIFDLLEQYGVHFRYIRGERLIKQPPGHSCRRSYPTDFSTYSYLNRGLAYGLPLREKARQVGVCLYEPYDAITLLKDGQKVSGALALNVLTGESLAVYASAVILCCGGGAGIYKNTNNTSDVTCDAYRLGLEAGAELVDMEFVQFYPTMMFHPTRVVISNPLFGDGAVVKNRLGEEFLSRYTPLGNKATRDLMARAIQMEIRAGRGDPDCAYVDCSAIPSDTIDAKYPELKLKLKRSGLDLGKDLLPVAPTAHFYLGGIKIFGDCETKAEGLFACGEAVGGLHGANRLSGNALTEAALSGRIAAEAAAAYSRRNRLVQLPRLPEITREDGIPLFDSARLIDQLRAMLWEKASVIKNETDILAAIASLREIEDHSKCVPLRTGRDIRTRYKLDSFIWTAKMLLSCSLNRKESRGSFYREDHPNPAAEYCRSQKCSLSDGQISVCWDD